MFAVNPDYTPDPDERQQQQHSRKMNGFGPISAGFPRSSTFTAFTNNRSRHLPSSSIISSSSTFRDTPSSFYPSNDLFTPQMTSPSQSHMQAFDSRGSFDFGAAQPNPAASHKSYGIDPFGSSQLQLGKGLQHHSNPTYSTGVQLASQTPYGPHVPTSTLGSASLSGTVPGGPSGIGLPSGLGMTGGGSARNDASQEEISTIFVVGFPDDMQEREFQNMFTFSRGFEAATLKIPNKEYTAYNGAVSSGVRSGPGYSGGYGGSNDPYNIVTVNQGGVLVDAGRDGTLASWPASVPGEDAGTTGGHYSAPGLNVPRKQIIGFAKFRTREDAIAARDLLQGRRVDIEKGAVLKAEMARKNLHTKRGVGPVSGGATTGSVDITSGLAGGLQPNMMSGLTLSEAYNSMEMSAQERQLGALGAMGLGFGGRTQWRDQFTDPSPSVSGFSTVNGHARREEEGRREREAGVISAMGLGVATRGPREREEEERERRRKEKEQRLRAGNAAAFDAFHSVPIQVSRQGSQASVLCGPSGTILNSVLSAPTENGVSAGASPMMGNGYDTQEPVTQSGEESVGPWDAVTVTTPQRPSSPNRTRSSNNSNSDLTRPISPQITSQDLSTSHQPSQSASSSSSIVGGSQSSGNGNIHKHGAIGEIPNGVDGELSRATSGLAVSTNNGSTSPQLPSPASGASSGGSGRNIDQNPPINTLYVGNLPTSPPPPGYPPEYLEESLRSLFEPRPGFRRLCFKQKNNSPMCFVEFEDTSYATKALSELYGDTLGGLVKGGIRLSYSKNPLGIRTPTSTGHNGNSLQQQQMQVQHAGCFTSNTETFHHRFDDQSRPTILRRDTSNNPPPPSVSSYNNYMISPPPRFFSPTPSSTTFSATGASSAFLPRSSHATTVHGYTTFAPFGLSSPSHSTIPDQTATDHETQHYMHRTLSPPSNNIEAARAS